MARQGLGSALTNSLSAGGSPPSSAPCTAAARQAQSSSPRRPLARAAAKRSSGRSRREPGGSADERLVADHGLRRELHERLVDGAQLSSLEQLRELGVVPGELCRIAARNGRGGGRGATLSPKNAQPSLLACFASYIAASACRSSAAPSAASRGHSETPTLAPIWT
jgi:hypothetical protein